MILSVPIGSIIDIWVDAIMLDGQTPVFVSFSSAGSFVDGAVIAVPLDGVTTHLLTPIGYSTTF
jgi:hypothetical protein